MEKFIFLGKYHDEHRVLVRHLREWASKNVVLPILISFVLFTFSSCEYFGEFICTIYNNTNDTTYVSYTPQLRSLEDILPTYDHGKDYEQIRLLTSSLLQFCLAPHDGTHGFTGVSEDLLGESG